MNLTCCINHNSDIVTNFNLTMSDLEFEGTRVNNAYDTRPLTATGSRQKKDVQRNKRRECSDNADQDGKKDARRASILNGLVEERIYREDWSQGDSLSSLGQGNDATGKIVDRMIADCYERVEENNHQITRLQEDIYRLEQKNKKLLVDAQELESIHSGLIQQDEEG